MKRKCLEWNNNRPMDNGIHLRSDHLTLEYRRDKPMLKSIGKQTHHLAKMGIRRSDGDFLRIDEALYLAELGAAVVLDPYRNPLAVAQLYTLMCSMGVSLFKYAVYAQLVRAGYVVRKPSEFISSSSGGSTSSECYSSADYAVKVSAFHFPPQLLDQFPSITASASDDRLAISLHIPPIQTHDNDAPAPATTLLNENNNKDDENGCVDDNHCSSAVTIENLNGQMNAHIRKIEHSLLRDVRRQHSEPWNNCRPRWWPSMRSLHALDSWRLYALRRDALLQQRGGRRPQTERRRESCFDYELFTDEKSSTTPIYSVIIVEPNSLPGAQPNFGVMFKLATECRKRGSQLLVATGSPTCVKISRFLAESDESLSVVINGDVAEIVFKNPQKNEAGKWSLQLENISGVSSAAPFELVVKGKPSNKGVERMRSGIKEPYHDAVLVMYHCDDCNKNFMGTYEFGPEGKSEKWGCYRRYRRIVGCEDVNLSGSAMDEIFNGMPGRGSYSAVNYNCAHWANEFCQKVLTWKPEYSMVYRGRDC
ncbi:IG-like protein [Globodera pallida]|nr:IG-like protein [Globodera pallida]